MKILAVDYGDSRTGLATCDHTEFLTTPITPQITLKARNKVAARVCEAAKEIGAELIVIGLPLNMDGTEQPLTARARKFANKIHGRFGVSVKLHDERLSTVEARAGLFEHGGFRALNKGSVDSASAVIILESYFEQGY